MSKFDQPSSDDTQVWDGPEGRCATCGNARAACDCDHCLLCGYPLSGNCEIRDESYPYCSIPCAIEAERDSGADREHDDPRRI